MTTTPISYQRHRFSSEIISHAVWLYHRFFLSFREVEDLLAERGVTVTYESVRKWCRKFGPAYARRLKKRQGQLGDAWFLDEVFVSIQGEQQYLWRAVDQDGDTLDILVVWSKNLTPAGAIRENESAQIPETDLKQVLWKRRSWRERPKSLI